jgi:hypothetical protein
MKPTTHLTPAALAAAVLLTLTACGGGGGSDASTASNPTSTTSVSGIASKGLLKRAKVTAYRLADGKEEVLATTETTDEGAYAFTGLPSGALVLFKVEVVPGVTKMLDEATDDETDAPAGLTLRAAVVLQGTEASNNTLQITPFSEMAVAKAANAPQGLTISNVEAANADLATLAPGVNLLIDAPVFKEVSGKKQADSPAALLLAAVSGMANDIGTGGAASALGCTQAAQPNRVKCVVDEMSKRGKERSGNALDQLTQLLDSAKNAAKSSEGYDESKGVVPPLVTPPTDLVPPAQNASAIQSAKALLQSIRNNQGALQGLEQDARAIASAMDNTISPFETDAQALVQVMFESISALDEFADGTWEGELDLPADDIIAPTSGDALNAGCTVYSDPTMSTMATTYENADYMVCRVTHSVRTESGRTYRYQQQFFVSPLVTSGQYQVKTRVIKQEIINGIYNYEADATVVLAPFKTSTVTLARDVWGEVSAFTLNGDLPPGFDTKGALKAGSVVIDLAATPSEGPSGSTKLNLIGLVKGVNGTTVLSTVGIKEGSYVQAKQAVKEDLSGVSVVDNSLSAAHLIVVATATNGQGVTGTFDWSDYDRVKNGDVGNDLPRKLSFNGKVLKDASTALFEGTANVALGSLTNYDPRENESSSNFLAKTITLDGKLIPSGMQPLLLNLTLSETSSFGKYALAGSYQQTGGASFTVSASGTRDLDDGTITFNSVANNVKMTLTASDELPVYIKTNGGVNVGVLDRKKGRIDYTDGTFESF